MSNEAKDLEASPFTIDSEREEDDGPILPEQPFRDNPPNELVIESLPEDESNAPVHDQLPSVEQIKAGLIPYKKKGKWSDKKKILISAGCAIVALMLLIAMFSKGKNQHDEFEELDGRAKTIVNYLFDLEVSTLPSLKDGTTPQHRAALFVADGDAYQMELNEETSTRLVERYVLSVLYYHFKGHRWTHDLKFLQAIDHCDWWEEFGTQSGEKIRQGVECNSEGRVIKLNLAWNNLSGNSYPQELKSLAHLDSLHIHYNDVATYFPDVVRHMPKLKSLSLMKTGLRGDIPSWIGDMTSLTSLGLDDNTLTGQVPTSISKLSSLKLLGLDNNSKLHGNLELFKSMRKLEALYLENNFFTGSLEGAVTNHWPKLKELDVSNNMLDGHLEASMLNHAELMVIDLHHNLIDGNLPNNGLANTQLEYLSLRSNTIKGTIPDRFGFLANMKHLDLSNNQFTGTIPNTIEQLTDLRFLSTSGNFFDAQKLMDLSPLTKLQGLYMKSNNLTGNIPDNIGNLGQLRVLDLSVNGFTGGIPTWLGLLQRLEHLYLSRNELEGKLPDFLGQLPKLDALLIDGNKFHGSTDNICNREKRPSFFASDCYPKPNGGAPEIQCLCCTTCCLENDTHCHALSDILQVDSIADYGWSRPNYSFNLLNAPMTISEEQIEESGSAMDALP